MRHVRALAILGAFAVVAGSVLLGGTAVSAAPSANPSAPVAVPAPQTPTTACTIGADAAIHITGLGATKDGYVVVDGANSDWSLKIAYLDTSCKRTYLQSYSGAGARDPQDLSIDSSGVIWVADTGDSATPPSRSTIAVWKVTSKSSSKLYHFSYPDGAHNSSAMLLNGDGTPIFITKATNGPATLYVPTGPLSSSSTVALKSAGTFQPQVTHTDNKFGPIGQNAVTGAAKSPDGKKVVIRTYSDAYEWDVTNGDVIGAITKSKPRITPLQNDNGDAIAYSADGSSFLTVANSADPTPINKWKPAAAVAASAGKTATKGTSASGSGGIKGWLKSLSLNQLMLLLGAIGLFGLVLILVGVLGITRSRKVAKDAARRAARSGQGRATASVGPDGAGGVYGSSRPGANGRTSDPYRSADARQPAPQPGSYSGGQYGGTQHSGGQHSGGQYGGGQSGTYGRPADPYGDDDMRR